MTDKSVRYTPEFKRQMVELVRRGGDSSRPRVTSTCGMTKHCCRSIGRSTNLRDSRVDDFLRRMRSNAVSFSDDGYFLKPAERGEDPPMHTMGGPQAIPGAISPNSGAPLLLVATLNLRDARLEVPPTALERLHLLYSWTCPMSEGLLSYRETERGVELLQA